MEFVETLTPQERKKFRMYAYASTWFGCIADVMMESSAIIILFLTALKSSPTLTMLSTSLNGILSMLLMFPAAGLVNKIGAKKTVYVSSVIAISSYLLIASAPFWGSGLGMYIAFLGCFAFCVSKPIWTAAWYVIMGDILLPEERGSFLGLMRFSYYVLTGTAFFLIGLAMGKEPPIYFMQLVIAVTGLLGLGRIYVISRLRLAPHESKENSIVKAFSVSVKNGPLVSFSIYSCLLCLGFSAVIPMTLLYMKKGLNCGDNIVQIISSIGIAGSMVGFLLYGKILKAFGMRILQIGTHLLFLAIPILLSFFGSAEGNNVYYIGGLHFIGSFAFACFLCIVSQETLALSRPGNVAMSTAFCQTYFMLGTACSRVGTSVLIGSGVLSLSWKYLDFTFCKYQTIFLFCAALVLVALALLPSLPSMIPEREDWYKP